MSKNEIYIGFDEREAEVFHVCVQSIISLSKKPVSITPLTLGSLSHEYDMGMRDGSNAFVYTRFLCPYLSEFKGWSLFLDGDMVLLEDINNLFEFIDNEKAVMVVKHNYRTKSKTKYMGAKNEDYPRKNWSSVILWNNSHPKNKILVPELIKSKNGKFLHRFEWLSNEDVGELPIEWNWLPDEFGKNDEAKLLHYTLGAPCFPDYADTPMASHYFENLMRSARVDRDW